MKFTVSIEDKALLAGIDEAYAAYVAGLPKDKDGNPEGDEFGDSASYFQGRMLDVAKSYAKQFGYDPEVLSQKQAEVAEIQAKMAAKGI